MHENGFLKKWLFKKNDNFSAICTMANIDQNLVRKIASELIRMHVQKTHKKSIAKVEVGVEVGSPMTLPEELYINIETRITEQFSMLEFTY
jgi:hypothetical protein